jgi:hypothetical protein
VSLAHYAILLMLSLWPLPPTSGPQSKTEQGGSNERANLEGFFFHGDGFVHETMEIYRDGRFAYGWGADDGGFSREEGTIDVVGGLLTLSPDPKQTETNRQGTLIHPRYRPTRWGDRLYLLTEKDFPRFCDHINMGLEPRRVRSGPFFMKMSRKDLAREDMPDFAKAFGSPDLSERWSRLVLKTPIQGKIVEVLDRDRARVDLGSEHGLRADIALFAEQPGGPRDDPHLARLTVVELEPKRCLVAVNRSNWNFSFRELKKDQKITSRIPQEIIDMMSGISLP